MIWKIEIIGEFEILEIKEIINRTFEEWNTDMKRKFRSNWTFKILEVKMKIGY